MLDLFDERDMVDPAFNAMATIYDIERWAQIVVPTSPIHLAAYNSDVGVIGRAIASEGACILSKADESGVTVCWYGCFHGNEDMARMLGEYTDTVAFVDAPHVTVAYAMLILRCANSKLSRAPLDVTHHAHQKLWRAVLSRAITRGDRETAMHMISATVERYPCDGICPDEGVAPLVAAIGNRDEALVRCLLGIAVPMRVNVSYDGGAGVRQHVVGFDAVVDGATRHYDWPSDYALDVGLKNLAHTLLDAERCVGRRGSCFANKRGSAADPVVMATRKKTKH